MGAPRRIAVVAGGGAFPREVTDACRAAGDEPVMIALRGFADRATRREAVAVVDMLDPAGLISRLSMLRPDAVVLAGGVVRPGPLAVASAYAAFRNRNEIARVLALGDDGLLRAVVAFIEERGWPVLGADSVAPALLAPAGTLTARGPDDAQSAAIGMGRACLAALSPFDVGQALVVSGSRILAVEGPEGTRAMLGRVAEMRRKGRLRKDDPPGILVKAAKAGQDRRVDLPAVGPRTIAEAAEAGLAGIAVAAGDVILIEKDELLRAAERRGLFVSGFAT